MTHWNPLEDYCIVCGGLVRNTSLEKKIIVYHTCHLNKDPHPIYRSVHDECRPMMDKMKETRDL